MDHSIILKKLYQVATGDSTFGIDYYPFSPNAWQL